MILPIIGIILAIIVLLIIVLLLLRVKLVLGLYENGKFDFKIKFLRFSFGGEKQKEAQEGKSEGKMAKRIKSQFGLDLLDKKELKNSIENGEFTDKASRLAAVVMLFLGQIKYLFSKLRVDRLYTLIICGGDGAEAAIDYGITCSAIYPLMGYLNASLNMKEDAQDVQIYCDFENENKIEFELILSIRMAYILKAFTGAVFNAVQMKAKLEETQNGN